MLIKSKKGDYGRIVEDPGTAMHRTSLCRWVSSHLIHLLATLAGKSGETRIDSKLAMEDHRFLGRVYYGVPIMGRRSERGVLFESVVRLTFPYMCLRYTLT